MASALRSASCAFAGPIETSTTSPSPVDSFSRSASSTAWESKGFRAPSPERSSRLVSGSMRRLPSGTCLTQTAIFMRRGLYSGRIPCYAPDLRARTGAPVPVMRRHRTTARGVLFLAAILGLVAGTAAAAAPKVPDHIIFPVVGQVNYIADFGTPRPGGRHQGNDRMAAKKSPAVAAEAGTVKYWTTSRAAGCMLYLYGESGTIYYYIHLNNDLTMRNDNRGKCVKGVAYTVKEGAKVAAGQQIAYVGDSGDANGGSAHLHFEVHPAGGRAVSPYPFLQKAYRLLFAAKPGTPFALTLTGTVVVWTQWAPASLKAQRADDGVLSAALIQIG